MSSKSVAVIIPFQGWNSYLDETLLHLDRLELRSFEVILLPDEELPASRLEALKAFNYKIVTIPTGKVSPAIKRDKGAESTAADILAFIDDDAYPAPDWLNKLLPLFDEPNVCAVGGPQVTPDSDTFWQKVSGATFLSVLNGSLVHRYWPAADGRSYEVDDWPTVNLCVVREDFLAVEGFDSAYWPGEDTKLCRDLVVKLRKRILYCPTAIVFHHRRSGFKRHLKQIGNYALHRGFFARKFPETSFRPIYLVPTLFLLFVLLGAALSPFSPHVAFLWALGLSAYALALTASVWSVWSKIGDFGVSLATVPYTFGTHLWYGFRFFYGIAFVSDLKSKLGR